MDIQILSQKLQIKLISALGKPLSHRDIAAKSSYFFFFSPRAPLPSKLNEEGSDQEWQENPMLAISNTLKTAIQCVI